MDEKRKAFLGCFESSTRRAIVCEFLLNGRRDEGAPASRSEQRRAHRDDQREDVKGRTSENAAQRQVTMNAE